MKRLPFVVAGALLIALVWFLWPVAEEPADPSAPRTTSRVDVKSPTAPPRSAVPPPEPRSTLADSLNAPSQDIHADLRIVDELVTTFRSNFPREGNPVGSNAEITAALTGQNRLRLALVPPDHPAINGAGELRDRWGTPFFFHALSASRLEIRSAGPDRKMWTDDDVVLTP